MMRFWVILLIALAVVVTAPVVALAWLAQTIVQSPRAGTAARAYDQLGNAVLGGDPQRTVTERAGKAMKEGRRWACVLCKLLDRIDPDHCTKYGDRHPGA